MSFEGLRLRSASFAAYRIPPDVMARGLINPKDLETFTVTRSYRTTEPGVIADFYSALTSARSSPTTEMFGYRLKAVAYDEAGASVIEVFASEVVPLGTIGGQPVAFAEPDLVAFLVSLFTDGADASS